MIILRQCQSYDRLAIDVSFTKRLTKDPRLFSDTIHLQNRKIVGDSVRTLKKGKVDPYSLPSVGPGADPGVQAVSPQVT